VNTLKADGILLAFDEFLMPTELDVVRAYVMRMEDKFSAATTMPMGRPRTLDLAHRRARVISYVETAEVGQFFKDRIEQMLPSVLEELRFRIRPAKRIAMQVASTLDGDFYKPHTDNSPQSRNRRLPSFMYFCHRCPLGFQGGDLRIYGTRSYAEIKNPGIPCPCHLPHAESNGVFRE
jgi:SM-20-related protein